MKWIHTIRKKASLYEVMLMVPFFWLVVFFVIPFLIVLKLSFSQVAISIPPYQPVFSLYNFFDSIKEFSVNNYLFLFEESLYLHSFLSSVAIALFATFMTFLIAYPIAYAIAKASPKIRSVLLIVIILPFWTSFLIRIYAWVGILKYDGFINKILLFFGFIDTPLMILHTYTAVIIGLVYGYLPFMIFPIYTTLSKIDQNLVDAASDLGCKPFFVFWKIIFPLSLPGVFAGLLLVFIATMAEFMVPDILGGSNTLTVGKILWNEFFVNRDWPLASAFAVILLLFLITPMIILQNIEKRKKQ